MKESIEFTPREQFLINYYKDRAVSGVGAARAYHVATVCVPLVCGLWAMASEEYVLAVVGYTLLLYRVVQVLISDFKYAGSLASIIGKYESRIEELESATEKTSI